MLFLDLQWETKYQKEDLRISEDRRKRKKEAWFSYMMKHLRNERMEGLSLIKIEPHVHTWWCPFVPYCHLKSTKEEEDRKWKKEEWLYFELSNVYTYIMNERAWSKLGSWILFWFLLV